MSKIEKESYLGQTNHELHVPLAELLDEVVYIAEATVQWINVEVVRLGLSLVCSQCIASLDVIQFIQYRNPYRPGDSCRLKPSDIPPKTA